MSIEHIVVHKGTDYHCAFPETIRLQNTDLITAFREVPFAPADPDHRGVGAEDIDMGPQHPQMAHHHRHPQSRAALVRSTDGGLTWDPASRIVIDASDGTQDLNLGTIAQVSSGELVFNNMRLFTNLNEAEAEGMSSQRRSTYLGLSLSVLDSGPSPGPSQDSGARLWRRGRLYPRRPLIPALRRWLGRSLRPQAGDCTCPVRGNRRTGLPPR